MKIESWNFWEHVARAGGTLSLGLVLLRQGVWGHLVTGSPVGLVKLVIFVDYLGFLWTLGEKFRFVWGI